MRLKDKVAVVTGSSRSIGRAIALGYAREGAKVVINYRSDRGAADSAVAEAEEVGTQAIAVRADTSSSSDVAGLMAAAVDRFGRIDILVNNAGILIRTPILEIEESEWDRILDVNLKGFFLCSQGCGQADGRPGRWWCDHQHVLGGRHPRRQEPHPLLRGKGEEFGCSPASWRSNWRPTRSGPTPSRRA